MAFHSTPGPLVLPIELYRKTPEPSFGGPGVSSYADAAVTLSPLPNPYPDS